MKFITIEIDGREQKVWAEKRGRTLWIHHQGQTWTYETPLSKNRRHQGEEEIKEGLIKAPMPGKVMKVLVKEGESIEAKTCTVVLEAMKMEYRLESDVSGIVQSVSCQEGEQVSLGQVLVEVK